MDQKNDKSRPVPRSRWSRFMNLMRNPRHMFLSRERKKELRVSVLEAYEILLTRGIKEALSFLKRNRLYLSPGTQELFKSIVAQDDQTWIKNMSVWLKGHSRSKIVLSRGQEPRFFRIGFEELPSVEWEMPKISVIMPAHNAQETIESAVQSILKQSWHNLELIVVNDKSSDGTAEILTDLEQCDSRLSVFHNPVNVGPYVSKNLALAKAAGAYITGHDADDIALPDRLERQVRAITANPDFIGSFGHMIRLDEMGRFNFPSRMAAYSFDGVLRRAMVSLMLKRDVFEKVGYWDCVRFGADSEFLCRIESAFPDMIAEDRCCTMFCLNREGSLTNNSVSGIAYDTGLSPIRIKYRDSWREWHEAHPGETLYRPFSNSGREFDAPKSMEVPQSSIDQLKKEFSEYFGLNP